MNAYLAHITIHVRDSFTFRVADLEDLAKRSLDGWSPLLHPPLE